MNPASFRALIALWPNAPAFARDCGAGVTAGTVRQWASRDRIPAQYFAAIIAGAWRRGMLNVTADLLVTLAAQRPDGRSRSA